MFSPENILTRTLKYIYLHACNQALVTQLLFSWLPNSYHKKWHEEYHIDESINVFEIFE